MISCKKASILLSASLDRELSFLERFALRIHLTVCKWCRRFRVQITFLHSLGSELDQEEQLITALPSEAKQRIQKSIDDELNQ